MNLLEIKVNTATKKQNGTKHIRNSFLKLCYIRQNIDDRIVSGLFIAKS